MIILNQPGEMLNLLFRICDSDLNYGVIFITNLYALLSTID